MHPRRGLTRPAPSSPAHCVVLVGLCGFAARVRPGAVCVLVWPGAEDGRCPWLAVTVALAVAAGAAEEFEGGDGVVALMLGRGVRVAPAVGEATAVVGRELDGAAVGPSASATGLEASKCPTAEPVPSRGDGDLAAGTDANGIPAACAGSAEGSGTGWVRPGSGTPPARLMITSPAAKTPPVATSASRLRMKRERRPESSTKTAPSGRTRFPSATRDTSHILTDPAQHRRPPSHGCARDVWSTCGAAARASSRCAAGGLSTESVADLAQTTDIQRGVPDRR